MITQTPTWQHTQETNIPAPDGIRTRNPVGDPPQTRALDRAATGMEYIVIKLIVENERTWQL
jgi:hypothetical protein